MLGSKLGLMDLEIKALYHHSYLYILILSILCAAEKSHNLTYHNHFLVSALRCFWLVWRLRLGGVRVDAPSVGGRASLAVCAPLFLCTTTSAERVFLWIAEKCQRIVLARRKPRSMGSCNRHLSKSFHKPCDAGYTTQPCPSGLLFTLPWTR